MCVYSEQWRCGKEIYIIHSFAGIGLHFIKDTLYRGSWESYANKYTQKIPETSSLVDNTSNLMMANERMSNNPNRIYMVSCTCMMDD